MISDPLTHSASTPAHMYEFGEYDGLVDLDAVLHGTTTTSNNTATDTPTTSPTANAGFRTDSNNAGDGTHYLSLQGRTAPHLGSGEPGSTPAPHGRSSARKPGRESVNRGRNDGGTSASADRHPGSHGANPMTAGDNGLTVTTAPTATVVNGAPSAYSAAAAPPDPRGSAGGQRRCADNASGTRYSSGDTGVHLPVIPPSQQRRTADTTAAPSRVRVSPLTQEHSSPTPSNTTAASSSANTPHNARSAASMSSPGQSVRPPGAKTVMSANNLAALQRGGTERVHTGPLSTGDSSNRVPPYLAPPLSLLHARVNLPQSNMAPLARPTIDGTGKRGESVDGAHGNASVTVPTSPTGQSNAWVKDETRRMDRTSQEMNSRFSQERIRNSSAAAAAAAVAAAAAAPTENGATGKADETTSRVKANTSPAPAAPRAPVWASDYEVGRGDLIGGAASPDFGAMPRVAAPPLPLRANKTLSDSGKRTLPFRPPLPIPLTPPVGTTTSTAESMISPLRTSAQRAAQRPNNATGAAAKAVVPPPAAPLAVPGPAARVGSAASGNTASRANPAGASDLTSGPLTPGTTHRRVMNAVDTHVGVPGELPRPLKTTPATVLPLNDKSSSAGAGEGTSAMPQMPYLDDRRAALEAWAAFPALDVTMRHKSPTATQLRREQDFAAARPHIAQQLYQAVKGQAPQEFAGEPFEMNYDVHNVVVQLRHRNRPLMMAYPAQLPLDLDTRPRLRRQRTPRSFYGTRFAHVGDTWFRNALDDARHIDSPDIESMERREEEEFVRNGGDPAHRRNRYGQANNNTNNQQQQQQRRAVPPHSGTDAPSIEQMNRNVVRMEQPAA